MRFTTVRGWSSYAFADSFFVFGFVWRRECVRCRWDDRRHDPEPKWVQLGIVLFNRFFGVMR